MGLPTIRGPPALARLLSAAGQSLRFLDPCDLGLTIGSIGQLLVPHHMPSSAGTSVVSQPMGELISTTVLGSCFEMNGEALAAAAEGLARMQIGSASLQRRLQRLYWVSAISMNGGGAPLRMMELHAEHLMSFCRAAPNHEPGMWMRRLFSDAFVHRPAAPLVGSAVDGLDCLRTMAGTSPTRQAAADPMIMKVLQFVVGHPDTAEVLSQICSDCLTRILLLIQSQPRVPELAVLACLVDNSITSIISFTSTCPLACCGQDVHAPDPLFPAGRAPRFSSSCLRAAVLIASNHPEEHFDHFTTLSEPLLVEHFIFAGSMLSGAPSFATNAPFVAYTAALMAAFHSIDDGGITDSLLHAVLRLFSATPRDAVFTGELSLVVDYAMRHTTDVREAALGPIVRLLLSVKHSVDCGPLAQWVSDVAEAPPSKRRRDRREAFPAMLDAWSALLDYSRSTSRTEPSASAMVNLFGECLLSRLEVDCVELRCGEKTEKIPTESLMTTIEACRRWLLSSGLEHNPSSTSVGVVAAAGTVLVSLLLERQGDDTTNVVDAPLLVDAMSSLIGLHDALRRVDLVQGRGRDDWFDSSVAVLGKTLLHAMVHNPSEWAIPPVGDPHTNECFSIFAAVCSQLAHTPRVYSQPGNEQCTLFSKVSLAEVQGVLQELLIRAQSRDHVGELVAWDEEQRVALDASAAHLPGETGSAGCTREVTIILRLVETSVANAVGWAELDPEVIAPALQAVLVLSTIPGVAELPTLASARQRLIEMAEGQQQWPSSLGQHLPILSLMASFGVARALNPIKSCSWPSVDMLEAIVMVVAIARVDPTASDSVLADLLWLTKMQLSTMEEGVGADLAVAVALVDMGEVLRSVSWTPRSITLAGECENAALDAALLAGSFSGESRTLSDVLD